MVANVDYRDSAQNNLLHLSLYEPSDSPTSIASINHTLVQEGYALINSAASYKSAYPEMYRALEVAKMEAKRNRAGACEFGDGQPIFFLIFTFLLLTILSRRLQLLTTKQSTHKRALYTI